MGRRAGIAAAVGAETLYGLAYVFTRGALEHTDAFALLAWRFDVAVVLLGVLLATRVIRTRITRAALPALALMALLDPVLYYVGETLGVQRTSASLSGLVLSAIPVASIAAATLLLGTRPCRRQVGGVALTLLGVATTVLATGLPSGAQATGYLMLLVAVLAFALYTVVAERTTGATDADKTVVMVAGGALCFTVLAALSPGAGTAGTTAPLHDPVLAVQVLCLAAGSTVGAYLLQNIALTALGAARYATFVGVSTVAALVAGALALGEHLVPPQLLGGGAILGGVYVANRPAQETGRADGG